MVKMELKMKFSIWDPNNFLKSTPLIISFNNSMMMTDDANDDDDDDDDDDFFLEI